MKTLKSLVAFAGGFGAIAVGFIGMFIVWGIAVGVALGVVVYIVRAITGI